ncbi:hypothetical protein FNF27_00665 [Cafeteria roenbergensis]|uniref:Short-chain dehydrogenase/reductase 3 n=2 Tax=Cafeteria roenbergensis TaxID=33653 RepID=A0A5A8EN32_CAFRO|nr:hypothetical protein FNF27_00665 [Cafeteria roenbergensis]
MEGALSFAVETAQNAFKAAKEAPTWAKAALAAAALMALREAYLSVTEKSVEGEVCLITGAGSGIGRMLAKSMAAGGAKVALLDINEAAAKEAAAEIAASGGHAFAARCDVTSHEDVAVAVAAAREALGSDITILVNNAGVVSGKPLLETSDRAIKRTFDVNVIAHYWTLKECLPSMVRNNHGHVVTVASAAGWVGIPRQCDYSASKWAANGLAEALRMELRHMGATGVSTTCVCPFYIDTGMFEGVRGSWLPTLPILKPDYVVASMMTAIRRRTPVLNMPAMVNLTPLMRAGLPVAAFDWCCDFLGITKSMDDFAGRSIDAPGSS